MPPEVRRPRCAQAFTPAGKDWICSEHGQVPAGRGRGNDAQPSPDAASPRRIFLSYGHDATEGLGRRTKADLEEIENHIMFYKN